MRNLVYLSLGGNIGDSLRILRLAIHEIQKLHFISHFNHSPFYKTAPVGFLHQPDFTNAACRFETEAPIEELFSALEGIEKKFKKSKTIDNGPRTLDIDLLFYGNMAYKSERLEIPHPRWKERLFVLIPLRDLTERIEIGGETFQLDNMIESLECLC